MTVNGKVAGSNRLICTWFVGTDNKQGTFTPEALEPSEEEFSE
jgi:uncharacterized protein YodC (DUF2158 family)